MPSSHRLLHAAMSPSRIVSAVNTFSSVAKRDIVVEGCDVTKVRARRNGRLELKYLLQIASSITDEKYAVTIAGTIYQDQETGEENHERLLARRKRRHSPAANHRLQDFLAYIPELRLLLRSLVMDDGFPGLSVALDAEAMKLVLRDHLNDDEYTTNIISNCDIDINVIHYVNSARRYTIRYNLNVRGDVESIEQPSLIGKIYKKPEEASRAFEIMLFLSRNGFSAAVADGVRIPRPIAYVAELQMVLMEDIPDPPLGGGLSSKSYSQQLEAAGRALAKFHACPAKAAKQLNLASEYRTANEISYVKTAARKSVDTFSHLARAFEDSFNDLVASARRFPCHEPVLLHGSFYSEHILLGNDRVTLIDLDNVCIGDPAKDLGNFLAHLKWKGIRRSWADEQMRHQRETFIKAYRMPISPELKKAIGFYYRASILRIAYRQLCRPKLHRLMAALLAETS